jgi:competence protein ComFC
MVEILVRKESWLRRCYDLLLDCIYPCSCEICHEPLKKGASLCQPCRDKLLKICAPFCNQCGEMFHGNITTQFICPNCSELDYDFLFARPAYQSSEQLSELIHNVKYRRRLYLTKEMAHLATEAFSDVRLQQALLEKWVVIPVPLHWSRQQTRFFNQSEEIGKHLAKMMELPFCSGLKRIRRTPTQTRLSRKQRLKNLKGAFILSKRGASFLKKHEPAGIILFDDVFTTGSTTQECAKVLRMNGQENVIVVTVMRG